MCAHLQSSSCAEMHLLTSGFYGCALKHVDLCVAGEAVGTEEQTAVTITGVPQAAFADHNVQYQFRTENSGGQVRMESLVSLCKRLGKCVRKTRSKIVAFYER